jgi:glycosyltransferase involved in cell wall biosynthesis
MESAEALCTHIQAKGVQGLQWIVTVNADGHRHEDEASISFYHAIFGHISTIPYGNSRSDEHMGKRILLLVSNDISSDQRVDKTCHTLMELGHEVSVIGRMRPFSKALTRPYATERLELFFDKGPLFYLELNIRFFFRLMRRDWDVIHANDLDTLLAAFLGYTSFARTDIVYDSHEFFTEVPELKGRWARKVWLLIEKAIFPRLKHVYTVSASIADHYHKTYGPEVKVMRNVPPFREWKKEKTRNELGLPEQARLLILQGAGINVSKGAEEAVLAMRELPEEYHLLFLGSGDVFEGLKSMVDLYQLGHRVHFRDRMPYEEMMQYTLNADLGLSLEKGDNLNYEYALPNKIFDYIAAGIPVLGGPTLESKRLVSEYGVGRSLEAIDPVLIAKTVEELFSRPEQMSAFREATQRAYQELNWARESEVLKSIYASLDG